MNLKEKLRIAGIRQSKVADEIGCTEQYVNQVLNGSKTSKKITSVASIMLDKEIESKPALKRFFDEVENG